MFDEAVFADYPKLSAADRAEFFERLFSADRKASTAGRKGSYPDADGKVVQVSSDPNGKDANGPYRQYVDGMRPAMDVQTMAAFLSQGRQLPLAFAGPNDPFPYGNEDCKVYAYNHSGEWQPK